MVFPEPFIGLTDIHCHGGGGYYFSDPNPDNIQKVISIHKKSGTQFLVASLITDELFELKKQIKRLQPFVDSGEIVGIHLEGPYLSKLKCGAHNQSLLRTPKLDEIKELLDCGSIFMVTIAPELENSLKVIKYLANNGVVAAIGHSAGNYQDARSAIDHGATVVTHFNNAMSKIDDSGKTFATAILEDSKIYLELIVDGIHVSHENVLKVFSIAAERIILISDAMSASGGDDGEYQIGNLDVYVQNGIARLTSNNSLAGSTLQLRKAAEIAISMGISKVNVENATSANPLRLINSWR
mgnify:FL=1